VSTLGAMTGKERLLAAASGREADCLPCLPITMMLAADLAGIAYLDYATDFRAQAAAQLHVARELAFDHVSVISDPCCEAADCGSGVIFYDDTPPTPDDERAILRDKSALRGLDPPDPRAGKRMSNRLRATAALAEAVGDDLLVEGWVEGPCAEACDLRGINRFMVDFYDDPAFVRDLVERVTETAIAFGRAQVEAGAGMIGIGDAASSLIGPALYEEFVWPAARRLVDALHEAGAICRMHICGNSRAIMPLVAELGCEIVDVDSPVPMDAARAATGPDQLLCGNLDPVRAVLAGEPGSIRGGLAACHAAAGERYVVGAGCEIPRGTPVENVRALVEFARSTLLRGSELTLVQPRDAVERRR
jgi:MtaA/CmuA family methyltransferase